MEKVDSFDKKIQTKDTFQNTAIKYQCSATIYADNNVALPAFACRMLLLASHTVITHTHTQPFNGPLSRTTRVSRYQKGKTNLDFTGARDGEWQWNQLGHMQVCTLLQTDNHTSTPPLCFLQAGCPSCCPTNSIKALKAKVQ